MRRLRARAFGMIVLALAGWGVAAQQPATHPPDVIFVPSTDAVVDAMFALARVARTDVVYDLGCGDGKIVIAAARRFGARGVGIDIDPDRIREANLNARAAGVQDRVTFILGDIFSDDVKIGEATVVTLYLLPSLNERLRPKLWRELKPGTRVVSNSFGMGEGWPPEKSQQAGDYWVYLWSVPGRVESDNLEPRSKNSEQRRSPEATAIFSKLTPATSVLSSQF